MNSLVDLILHLKKDHRYIEMLYFELIDFIESQEALRANDKINNIL